MPTPHNEASICGIAETVLMPGDPRRSEYIANTFLTSPKLVNNVRGIQGYTGTYKDVPVTVMASGMGIPSISIYSWELYSKYDVKNIIRVGSAGGLQDDVRLKDVVAGLGACTNSRYIENFGLHGTFAPTCDYALLTKAVSAAKEMGIDLKVGNLLSSDNFYYPFDRGSGSAQWKQMGVLAVEMEAAGLYTNAAYFHRGALCLCTISDHLFTTSEELTPEERQTGFNQMIEIALNTAVKVEDAKNCN